MKKSMLMAAAFLMAGAASAEMLVSWEGDSAQYPTNTTLGVSGIIFGAIDSGKGSDDGTYGPIGSGASTAASAYKTKEDSWVDVRISNNSGQDLQLSEIVFDYYSIWDTGPQKVEVIYNYGALDDDSGTLLTTVDAPGFAGGGTTDYLDFSVSLQTLLTDSILANGQSATFSLKGIDASASTVNGLLDNIAFTGTVIPEPATLGLFSMVSVGIIFIRRRLRM